MQIQNRIQKFSKIISIFRIIIGFLFLYSSISKFIDLSAFGESILMYNILFDSLVPYFAILLPGVELVIGFLLLVGYRIKSASLISAVLMIIFIIAISINFYRGEIFDCGCFETSWFGINSNIGWPILIRNTLWFVLSILFIISKSSFALDNYSEKNKSSL